MNSSQIEAAALVAMLVSLPLVSLGTTEDVAVATVAGAVLLAVGLAALTALRFVDLEEDS